MVLRKCTAVVFYQQQVSECDGGSTFSPDACTSAVLRIGLQIDSHGL